ncbi:hypothetical protein Hanom_Chr15g01361551 [Helianthus anomalus]
MNLLFVAEMSTAVMNVTIMMPATDSQINKTVNSTELLLAKCDCCELTKECTPEYIKNIRVRYNGNRMCRLCEAAVKDEMVRNERLIDTEEAMTRHMNFCRKSTSSDPPLSFAIDLIEAMRRFIRRGLDSPRALRSMSNSPLTSTGRKVKHAFFSFYLYLVICSDKSLLNSSIMFI